MNYERILNRLGPCGLSCEKCFAYTDGDIANYSRRLKEKLGNFDIYARRFKTLVGDDIFDKYPDFKQMLAYFAAGSCQGCRKEQCKIFKQCGVRPCHQEKKVDFCFQCDAFPCTRTNFDEHLYKRWVKMNRRLQEIGVEAFYQETKDNSRYV